MAAVIRAAATTAGQKIPESPAGSQIRDQT